MLRLLRSTKVESARTLILLDLFLFDRLFLFTLQLLSSQVSGKVVVECGPRLFRFLIVLFRILRIAVLVTLIVVALIVIVVVAATIVVRICLLCGIALILIVWIWVVIVVIVKCSNALVIKSFLYSWLYGSFAPQPPVKGSLRELDRRT